MARSSALRVVPWTWLVLVLACVSRAVHASTQAGAERVEAALRHLDRLALAVRSVKVSVDGFSVEGEDYDSLERGSFHRPLIDMALEGRRDEFRLAQMGAWDRGRISAIEFTRVLAAGGVDDEPRLAFYWDGTRGLRIDFEENLLTLMSEFRAMGAEFWPQEFHGFHGTTPLVALAKHARLSNALEVVEPSGDGLRLRFPCNPGLEDGFAKDLEPSRVPYLELTFEGSDSLRLTGVDYTVASRGQVHGYRALEWIGTGDETFATRFQYYRHAVLDHTVDEGYWRFAKLVFEVRHELETTPSFDGATACDAATNLAFVGLGNGYWASSSGADMLADIAAERVSRRPEAQRPVAVDGTVIASVRASIASGRERAAREAVRWPQLDQSSLETAIFERMRLFDIENGLCGQVCMAIVAKLYDKPTTFDEIRLRYPDPVLPLDKITDCLGDLGLQYSVVDSLDYQAEIDSRPFLIYLGDTEQTGHLALAMADGEANALRVWEPPNKERSIPRADFGSYAASSVAIVPSDWIAETSWPYRALALGLIVIAILLLWTRFRGWRPRTEGGTTVGLVLLAVVFALGCSEAAAGSARLVEAPTAIRVRVDWGQVAEVPVRIANSSPGIVGLRLLEVSCSCLRHRGERELSMGGGASITVPYQVTGDVVGSRTATAWLEARGSGATQRFSIPVEIETVGALAIEPSRLNLVGTPNDTVGTSFTITAPAAPDEATRPLTVRSDFDGLVIEGGVPSRIQDHALVEWKYDYTLSFPRLAAGVHVARLAFELPQRDGSSLSLEKSIQVQISPDR